MANRFPEAEAGFDALLHLLSRWERTSPPLQGPGPLLHRLERLLARAAAPLPCPPGAPLLAGSFVQLSMMKDPAMAARQLLDLPPPALERLRGGEGMVVFDGSSEGRPFARRHMLTLHDALDRAGLPAARAAYLQQNRNLAAAYAAFCAQDGHEPMRVAVADANGFALWCRLFAPAPRAGAWPFGFALRDPGPRPYRWLCLNYVLRAHRAALAEWLLRRPEPGFLSFSTRRSPKVPVAPSVLLADVAALLPDDPGAAGRVARLLESGLHLGGDTDGFRHPSERVLSLPVEAVAGAELFIVTETEMSAGGLRRWTEKTLKALASGLPFIVFGNPYTVADLGALGFDLLPDLVDHGYDAERDPATRFARARAAVEGFLARPAGFTPAEMARLRQASETNAAVFAREMLRVSALDPLRALLSG